MFVIVLNQQANEFSYLKRKLCGSKTCFKGSPYVKVCENPAIGQVVTSDIERCYRRSLCFQSGLIPSVVTDAQCV
jgi:hypothetical protein